MVSFKLGKDIEKDVFRLVTSVGQRKISESPGGIEPQTSEQYLLRSSCDTRPAYCWDKQFP